VTESIAAKGARYLVESRLVVRRVDKHAVVADCRGNGAVYSLGHNGAGWFCSCPARRDCAHLEALRRVVAVELRESS
jgi:hypothetical protein